MTEQTITRQTIQDRINKDYTDWTTPEEQKYLIENLPITVDRNGTYGFNEGYLGLGYVYSVTDYGRAAELTDQAIIEKVKKELLEHGNQLCKFAVRTDVKPYVFPDGRKSEYLTQSTYTLGTKIIIKVSKMGYAPMTILERETSLNPEA